MKLFQQLLLAPAALGLMAPVAASAADMNLAGINQYAGPEEQVTSISQFSDVKPTDWAYQALSNLIERYGCVAGYPNGTYKGGQAMTRYEAAALLNACLDRISEVTDELKRLMKEFEKELAVLRGRVDGLEAKVGELEATQFSTTTKLKGQAVFVIGGNSFSGTNSRFLSNYIPGAPGLGGFGSPLSTAPLITGVPGGIFTSPTPVDPAILPAGVLAVSGVPAFLPFNAGNYNGAYSPAFAALFGLPVGGNLNPVPPAFAGGTGAFGNGIPIGATGTTTTGLAPNNVFIQNGAAQGLVDTARVGGVFFPSNQILGGLLALAFPGASSTSFNYDVRLNFDTSFTGKDLLRTTLRADNFANSGFGAPIGIGAIGGIATLNLLEVSTNANCNTGVNCGDTVSLNRLFYQFPIGSNLTATVGARVRQDDMLAIWPSAYPADTILDVMTYAGAQGAYSLNLGGGAGLSWKSGGWGFSVNYIAANAQGGSPYNNNFPTGFGTFFNNPGGPIGGLLNSSSQSTFTLQLGYAGANWGAAFGYTYGQNVWTTGATPMAQLAAATTSSNNNYGLSAYWQPEKSGWIPSISVGWGITTFGNDRFFNAGLGMTNPFAAGLLPPGLDGGLSGSQATSWTVGLQWNDVFLKGNSAGMAVGQASYLTNLGNGGFGNLLAALGANGNAADSNLNWEWWYKFQVTDNISVTPAIFYLNNPIGQFSKIVGYSTGSGTNFSNFGALLKTTFKF